jgi:hypothetical protein
MKTDELDMDLIVQQSLEAAAKRRPDGSSELSDFTDTANSVQWLQILAAPRLFRGMARMPPREHLLRMVEIFLAYARRGDRYAQKEFEPVPYEQREPLALKLRELLATWTPPELPEEITETARALLHADGMTGGADGWDNLPDPEMPPEEYLLWPEGVPALLKAKQEPVKLDADGHIEGCCAVRPRR